MEAIKMNITEVKLIKVKDSRVEGGVWELLIPLDALFSGMGMTEVRHKVMSILAKRVKETIGQNMTKRELVIHEFDTWKEIRDKFHIDVVNIYNVFDDPDSLLLRWL